VELKGDCPSPSLSTDDEFLSGNCCCFTRGLDPETLREPEPLRGDRGERGPELEGSLEDDGKRKLRPEKLHFLLGVRVAVVDEDDDAACGAARLLLLGLVEPP
jgi:hypothetical protein